MVTSKEVFAERRNGEIDQAYSMALELMTIDPKEEWNRKALAWCLIDLINRDITERDEQHLNEYYKKLNDLNIDETDEILYKKITHIKRAFSPIGKLAITAKTLSSEGKHEESVNIYREIFSNNVIDDYQLSLSYGWELYKLCKKILREENASAQLIKKYLLEYFKLNIKKPSLLHSCILKIARELARNENLQIIPFLRIWGITNFQDTDYNLEVGKNNKEYPSLIESTLQLAAKTAIHSKNKKDIDFILPHIEKLSHDYPNNIWLQYYVAKGLLYTGHAQQALNYSVKVCKIKKTDAWAWGLVGDIYLETDLTLAKAFYCKAVLCNNQEEHKINLRLKLAQIFIKQNNFSRAKYEIQKILKVQEKVSCDVQTIIQQDWFHSTTTTDSNDALYLEEEEKAEKALYNDLPWYKANLGKKYIICNDQKNKFKLYVRTPTEEIEASITENLLKNSKIKEIKEGSPIQVKGEFDENKLFKIYTLKSRIEGELWDALDEQIGVIDHINHTKKIVHFIVNKEINGIFSLETCQKKIEEGDIVELYAPCYFSKIEKKYNGINIQETKKQPSEDIFKIFNNELIVSCDRIAFTENNFFIPEYIVNKDKLEEYQRISGKACLNFNKKKQNWGWKILKIYS